MIVLIALLTVGLILDCVVLIFLILIQLPKKEAGAGLAFGAGATDALFGAGSGTVLTKITKYAAGIFFALALILSLLNKTRYNRSTAEFQQGVNTPLPNRAAPPQTLPSPISTNFPATNAAGTNAPGTNAASAAAAEATNVPAISTNTPK
jgi:preprotein translocase subunit SecG